MFACFLHMLVNKRLGLGQSLRSVLFCCRLTSTKFNKNSVKCYYRYVKRQVTHHGHYSPVARGWKKGHTPPGGRTKRDLFYLKGMGVYFMERMVVQKLSRYNNSD